MQPPDKETAKQIIVEIIRCAGGRFDNKMNLFKAFYHAHLHYALKNHGYLSKWPIVHMPKGPGIESFDRLLGEMLAAGALETKELGKGPHKAFRFLRKNETCFACLPDGSVEAIAAAVNEVSGKSAAQVSHDSHRQARKETTDGQEMNVYLDLIPDAEYADAEGQAKAVADALRQVFGD